jgi:hypothetical protein
VDNDNEDDISDDEERMGIKTHKCKERIRRTDNLFEDVAIMDLVDGVETLSKNIKTRSLIGHCFDLSLFQERQQRIRDKIDDAQW